MKNFLDEDIQWEHIMRKLNTPFSVSTYPRGSSMGSIVWGYPIPLATIWYDNGEIYFEKNEIACVRKFLEYKYHEDNKYPSRISKDIFNVVEGIKKQKIRIKGTENLEELIKLLDSNSEYFFKLIGYISYRGAVQMCDVVQDKISNIVNFKAAELNEIANAKDYLQALTLPLYPSIVVEEKIESLKLSLGFSELSNEKQDMRVSEYIEKFQWLSYHWLVGTPLDRTEIKNKFLALEKTAEQELKRIATEQTEQEKEISSLTDHLKFSKEEKKLLDEFRVWVFMRTFIKDNINLAGYKLLPVLRGIAKQKDIDPEDIVWLTYDEIIGIDKLSIEEISNRTSKRKKGFSAGTIENVLIFDDFNKYNQIKEVQSSGEQVNEIKGSIAFKGIVKGIARVILFPKDQGKLNSGEILVTSMTTPDYLPAMGRAIGFITDEGGITCHAAIVAREMKKPCIIGTKKATKIIKDGDMVEVDAEKGIVKIIK